MTVKSNFKLDKRINSIDDIQTIVFNNRGFIGCKGFVFDNFVQAKDLTKCKYGTLVDVDDDNDGDDHCFKARDKNGNDFVGYFRFFIPEKLLKPIKKKYRPYSLAEWIEQHEIGEVINYRNKSAGVICCHMCMGYAYGKDRDLTKINEGTLTLGVASYSLSYLFEDYEIIEANGEWKPFGVEVEDE